MGAPVTAFCRMDDREIRLREPVAEPDFVIVQDPTLLGRPDVYEGLAEEGMLLINSTQTVEALAARDPAGALRKRRVYTVAASELALAHIGRPMPNAALLGAFVALTGELTFSALATAIRSKFPARIADANIAAARAAYEMLPRRLRPVTPGMSRTAPEAAADAASLTCVKAEGPRVV
jgi:pyruvate ferredoxin oxidoreductase gamma subunit